MHWKRFRLAIALLAVGAALPTEQAVAVSGECPYILSHPEFGSCGLQSYTGCADCTYLCDGENEVKIPQCET